MKRHGAALKAYYFLFYGSVGAYLAFFPSYLLGLGFTGRELGLVQMVPPLAGVIGALGWAAVADRFGAATRALRWCGLCALLPYLFLPFARTPLTVACVLVFHELAGPAIVPLVDAITYEWLRERGSGSYSRVRSFGTAGFVAFTQGLGLVLSARGERPGDIAVPVTLVLCVASYALAGLFLPKAPAPADRPSLRDAGAVLLDRRVLLLVLICGLHWLSCAPYDLLLGVYLKESGLPARAVGPIVFAGTAAEILVLLLFPALEKRFDRRALLIVAFAGTALRWLLLSEVKAPLAMAAVQLLHGLSFGVFWSVAVEVIGAVVPPRLRASGHALFSALVVGGGNTIGYRLSGMGLDVFGGTRPIFAIAAVVELLPLLLVIVLGAFLDTARKTNSHAVAPAV